MKKIILFITLMFVANASFAFPFFKPRPKPSPTPVAVEKIEKSKAPIEDAKKIVLELKSELSVAKSENAKLKNSLGEANNNVKKGFENIVKLNKDIEALKEWGVVQQAEAQKWLEKYNKAVKRYHRLKWIAAIIAAAGGVLLGLRFMNFVPPPYSVLVPIGGAGIFASLVWIFL
jgi:septal ring factor EnvC (AmiA/AmiB activator)